MNEQVAEVTVVESADQTKFDDGWNDPEFGDKKKDRETSLEEKVETSEEDATSTGEETSTSSEEGKTSTPEDEKTSTEEEGKTSTDGEQPSTEEETTPSGYKADLDNILGKIDEYKAETKSEIKSEVERILGSSTATATPPEDKKKETEPPLVEKLDPETVKSRLGDLDELSPEVAKGVRDVIGDLVAHSNKQQEVIDSLRVGAKKRDVTEEQNAVAMQRIQKVEGAHPGWQQLAQTKPFTDWLDSNPLHKRVAENTEDPAELIMVFDEFKKANPPKEETKTEEGKTSTNGGRRASTQETKPPEDTKTRVRAEAAETLDGKSKKTETQPPRQLTDQEGFDTGWDDPEFAAEDKVRKAEGRMW